MSVSITEGVYKSMDFIYKTIKSEKKYTVKD